MSHFVAPFQGLPNALVGLNSYNKLTDGDKLKANLDMANRQILQDEIRIGYEKSLIQSEKNRQAVLKVAEGNYEINASITALSSGIDMRMTAVIEQVELINTGLESLKKVMMIPDHEKGRLFNFSEGIRFLEQSLFNPKRYADALHYLLSASEMNHRDYLVNREIGKIYLYNSKTLDIAKSIEYLERSLDYCETEAPLVGGEVAQHLAFAYYLTKNFEKAIEMGDLAYTLNSDTLEAKYIAGECRLLTGYKKEGIEDIKLIVSFDRTYINQVRNNANISKLINIKELESIEEQEVEVIEDLEYEYSLDTSDEMDAFLEKNRISGAIYTKWITNGWGNTAFKEMVERKNAREKGSVSTERKVYLPKTDEEIEAAYQTRMNEINTEFRHINKKIFLLNAAPILIITGLFILIVLFFRYA